MPVDGRVARSGDVGDFRFIKLLMESEANCQSKGVSRAPAQRVSQAGILHSGWWIGILTDSTGSLHTFHIHVLH